MALCNHQTISVESFTRYELVVRIFEIGLRPRRGQRMFSNFHPHAPVIDATVAVIVEMII